MMINYITKLFQVHNATWDYPSMDYINRHDEEIVFTLAQVFPVPSRAGIF
jgi:hypothetical protein